MELLFEKIQGAGNDFIVIADPHATVALDARQVAALCNRHFGIGADGIILVRPSPRAECAAYMHYLNADGSLAEMCGNGVRCFAKYLLDHNLLSPKELAARSFVADTLAGPRAISFSVDKDGSFSATVNMGTPRFAPQDIPTTLSATREVALTAGGKKGENGGLGQNGELGENRGLEPAGCPEPAERLEPAESAVQREPAGLGEPKERLEPAGCPEPAERLEPAVMQGVVLDQQHSKLVVSCVNMGNPHAVVFLEYVDRITAKAFAHNPLSIDLDTPGAFLEGNTRLFPQKTNVELAAVGGKNRIAMRVYERGVGETLACGTGACATAVVACILGLTQRSEPIAVELPGGTLTVEWLPSGEVTLCGPAQTVFSGSFSKGDAN